MRDGMRSDVAWARRIVAEYEAKRRTEPWWMPSREQIRAYMAARSTLRHLDMDGNDA